MLKKFIVSYVLVIFSAVVVGWPLVSNAESTKCGVLAIGILAMLFISMVHLGSSFGAWRWMWGISAAVLSFGAPLAMKVCMKSDSMIWLILSLMFIAVNFIIARKSK